MTDVKALRHDFEAARAAYEEAKTRLESARSRMPELERELAGLREKAESMTSTFAVGSAASRETATVDDLARVRSRLTAVATAIGHLRSNMRDMERQVDEAHRRMTKSAFAVAKAVFDREAAALEKLLRNGRVRRQATKVLAAATVARGRLTWMIAVEDLTGETEEIEKEIAIIRNEVGEEIAAAVPLA
ncbi:MAG TPA: hypothetical protein ENK57_03070 [Polyangiaceae bacterium]|nr:hypothetical protein [Polyangiaceae bacterium]